jgi:SAM-dependent methyltransferase
MLDCPLCHHQLAEFYRFKQRLYHQCGFCQAIVMDQSLWPDPEKEKARYLEHLNEVEDQRFQRFVSPITNQVLTHFGINHQGLDFGAGHAPVITHVLKQQGYDIQPFDPLFFPNYARLNQQYDYICSCEVIEHFHKPDKMFKQLKSLMKPGGLLLMMTEIYHEGIHFHTWNYKNDHTHVFIYHRNTISCLAHLFGFRIRQINGRLIVLENID